MTLVLLLFLGVFTVSYLGTEAFRRWSIGRGVLDVPNDRSSHTTPTPRGGGIVFVLVSLAVYFALAYTTELSWGYLIGALLVAGVSLLDDVRTVSFVWRLAVHFLAAAVLMLDTVTQGKLASTLGPFDLLTTAAGVVWVVWMINAYNFMDGIDGIAGLQAVVAASSWSILAMLTGGNDVAIYAGTITFAVLGFLVHNWQPANVFMGDVGSAFLGFTLAAFPFLRNGEQTDSVQLFLTAGVIFLWFFVFDTVVTLIRRLVRREKVWQAHRSHLYQRMVIGGMRHASVTLIYGAFAAALSAVFIAGNHYGTSHTAVAVVVSVISILSAALILLSVKRRTV